MLPEVNLLPKYERQNSFLYVMFIIGSIVCLVLFAVLLFFFFHTKGNLKEVEENLHQLNEEKTLLEANLAPANEETNTFEAALHFAESYIVPTSSFIDELKTLLPKNSYLNKYSYYYQSVDIETQFEQMSDAAAYVQALTGSEFIKDVEVNEIKTADLEDDAEEETDDDKDMYKTIPRYEVIYSLNINQTYLKEEGESDE